MKMKLKKRQRGREGAFLLTIQNSLLLLCAVEGRALGIFKRKRKQKTGMSEGMTLILACLFIAFSCAKFAPSIGCLYCLHSCKSLSPVLHRNTYICFSATLSAPFSPSTTFSSFAANEATEKLQLAKVNLRLCHHQHRDWHSCRLGSRWPTR